MRVCLTLLISVAFLGAGPQSSFAVLDPTAGSAAGPAATTPAGSAAGTTGAQQSAATCPTPRLKGLPKTPQPANAVVPFKLTGLIAGAQYVLRVADFEVTGGVASGSVVKNKFTLFDPGGNPDKVLIAVVVDTDACSNAPWKLQKSIGFKAAPAPAHAPAPGDGPPRAPRPRLYPVHRPRSLRCHPPSCRRSRSLSRSVCRTPGRHPAGVPG